jgi:hypothetical protein
MQRRSWLLFAGSVALFAALGAVPRAEAQSDTMRCESHGDNREECAIERGARVELVRQLGSNPCRQNVTWGVGSGYLWVSGGCRAEFAVTTLASAYPTGPGNANATPMQLRVCRSEADRRLPEYRYEDVEVEPYHREGSTAWVSWRAGDQGGMCTVASNGRIIDFTTERYGGAGSTRITCESRSTGRQECPIPSGTQIRLVRQLSQNPCNLNDTYGRGASYVWVAKGCRGEFEVYRPSGPGGTMQVSCESSELNRQSCPIPYRANVRLMRQLSGSPCRYDRTWGFDERTIWVANGCRGLFEVARSGSGADSPDRGNVTRITCSSNGTARQECGVPGAMRVRLVRQISTNPCTLDRSYGIGVGHIWVSNGCRGEFDVTTGGPGQGTGLPAPPGFPDVPLRVTCESKGGERTDCGIRNGATVALTRQLSSAPCTRNSTWGTGNGVVWVTRGCRAEFEVR